MRRLIDGPDQDWLSAREAARWLSIGLSLFRELLAEGQLPRPVQFGRRRCQRWHWFDIAAWAHLRSLDREAPASATMKRRPASE